MKLNNKGFAITSVLYGLLILFVSLVGTYLAILVSKMNRLNNISEDINNSYGFNTNLGEKTLPYAAEYTGKYIFKINDNLTCVSYIGVGTTIDDFSNITFTTAECNNTKGSITSAVITEILYNGVDTDE